MADEFGPESAFEVLGKIEVDIAALKKSLGEAEVEVRKYAAVHRQIMADAVKPLPGGGFSEGGPGGEGPGSGGGEGGARHSPTAEFAHMARVVRHDLVPALSRLNPALAEFISAGAQSARTAVFFGGAIGGIAIAGAVVSEIIGKYIDRAKEMHAATLEASEAMRTWDFARAEAGIKRVTEAAADFALNVKTMGEGPGGQAGFWGWLVAATTVAVEKITGGLDKMLTKYLESAAAATKIGQEFELPKARIDEMKAYSAVLGQQAEYAKKTALTQEDLAKAYDFSREARQQQVTFEEQAIRLEAEAQAKRVDPEAIRKELENKKAGIEAEIKRRQEEIKRTGGIGSSAPASLKVAEEQKALVEKQIADVYGAAATLRTQIEEKAELKIAALREKTAQQIRESYFDEAQAFLHSREAMTAAANQQVLESETKIEAIRRQQAGTAESANSFEARLALTRQNAVGPIENAIAAEEELFSKRKSEIAQAREFALTEEDPKEKAQKLSSLASDLEAIEKGHAAASADLNQKLNVTKAQQDAKYADEAKRRLQEVVAEEERIFAHRVSMGQQTMQAQIAFERDAAADPRRTQQQREQAEERAMQMKMSYAEKYFKYYEQMGVQTWAMEEQTHREALSKTVEGSKAWFDEVEKISNLYKKIHDEAKGIVSQVGSAAEIEAKRHGKFIRNAQDLVKFAGDAEIRDADILRGGGSGKKPGEYLGAVGRMDMWRNQRQQFGDVGQALNYAFASPQQMLANTVQNTATRPDIYGQVKDQMADQVSAAKEAAASLTDLASAAQDAAQALRSVGDNPANIRPPAEDATRSMGLDYRVLETAKGKLYTNVPPNVDSAMGRSLALANRRGVNAPETFP